MMDILNNSDGNTSKLKVGAILVGASALIGTIASVLLGNIGYLVAIQQAIAEIGAVLAACGIRDLPILNP